MVQIPLTKHGYLEELLDTVEHHPIFEKTLFVQQLKGRVFSALRNGSQCRIESLVNDIWHAGMEHQRAADHVTQIPFAKRREFAWKAEEKGITGRAAHEPLEPIIEAERELTRQIARLLQKRCGCASKS